MDVGPRTSHSSGLDDLVPDRVAHELTDGVEFKLAHDVGAVRFRGFYANAKSHGYFLAALPFRKQLHDFALSRGEPAAKDSHMVSDRILLAEPVEQHVRGARREERTMVAERLNRGHQVAVGIRLHNAGADTSIDNIAVCLSDAG